jgi:alanyl-tRNA synthetase
MNLVIHVNKDAKSSGVDANLVIAQINQTHHGKGGGNSDFAQTSLPVALEINALVSLMKAILD